MSALLLPALAASYSGQGALYVDDMFSTYLYTGNGSTQTINNGIDLAGNGGLVWIKHRNTSASGAQFVNDHWLFDTVRGANIGLRTNATDAQFDFSNGRVDQYNANGFTIGTGPQVNYSTDLFASWTFRRAPKFFDVVTYTGNGVAGRQIAHNLGVQAGFITVKATSTTGDWNSYHRSATGDLKLNTTDAQTASRAIITAADASTFTVSGAANTNGVSYVAYLWAHDPSADGIIQCGSYVGNGGTQNINLGWEAQWVLVKPVGGPSSIGDWSIFDSMRGLSVSPTGSTGLRPNIASAESPGYISCQPHAAGFTITNDNTGFNASGTTYIYLAIRRPNKPPTTGAQVYSSSTASGVVNTGFPVDLHIGATRTGAASNHAIHARLTGGTRELVTSSTAAEATITDLGFDSIAGLKASLPSGMVNHFFRRATGFMDVVCYTTGQYASNIVPHNLGVVPELCVRKDRNVGAEPWLVGGSVVPTPPAQGAHSLRLNTTDASGQYGGTPSVTQNTFQYGTNNTGMQYVVYLFASLPSISKVGIYTGNGSSRTIDCGFSTGARFFLVKAANTTGSWWVYDSARGIVSAADPALQLNSTAAEITSADAVDPASVGIIVNQEATCSINATGVSYIFLAIA